MVFKKEKYNENEVVRDLINILRLDDAMLNALVQDEDSMVSAELQKDKQEVIV